MIINTPPMGWNSWNTFGGNINEELVKTMADAMVDSGYADAGYKYLVIDDCWSELKRDGNGKLQASKEKFPNGMAHVADYIHSKGLKFGMYSCAGNLTCAAYPASFEHEFDDAATFASWGVDFLKYDFCFKPIDEQGRKLYRRMGLALANCGRDILFSACSWGGEETHKWIKETGAHMWRSTGDIQDNWESIKSILNQQIDLQPYNGLGCFNDMDMLVVGMHGKGNVGLGGCNDIEYKTHFSAWALLNSPLMIGCDVRKSEQTIKDILQNREIIAINQDPAGHQPYLLNTMHANGVQAWFKLLANGDLAVGLFNLSDSDQYPYFALNDLGLNRSTGTALQCRNIWDDKDEGLYTDIYRSPDIVHAHDCKMLRCKLVKRP